MAAADTELVVEDLHAGYGGTRIVQGVSFAVAAGERLGVLGRNGAGKTTTLSAVMGLAECHGGRIRLDGREISAVPPYARAHAGLGYVPQTRDVFPSLTVEENLVAGLRGRPRASIDQAYALFPRLRERRGNYGNQLSGGEQQMLAVARALVGQPSVLLLDEPLEGLAPQVAAEVMAAIARLVEETAIATVLVEQHVDVVLALATRVLVLERGVPVFLGPPAELDARPEVLEHAIGLAKGHAGEGRRSSGSR